MATASHVALTPSTPGVFPSTAQSHNSITPKSSETASSLLQQNHDKHHIFFNKSGFHNHITHHLLTIFALGATPEQVQHAYDVNKGLQRSLFSVNEKNVAAMSDPSQFQDLLGKEELFHDWELFFAREIEKDGEGWKGVLNKYLFSRTEVAEAMLIRMFAGFYHPIIHLGFGIEFAQPAIIVEALAQAAVHDGWIGPFLLDVEKKATSSKQTESKTLVSLLDAVKANDKLRAAAHWEDGNKIRDGVLVRAPDEMIEIASQYTVRPEPEELKRKTAEMINANAYFTCASLREDKQVKFDFYYMHCINCSVFFSSFLNQDWLSDENKARLLEWKAREDLAMYASRAAPALDLKPIEEYKGKHGEESWWEIFDRANAYADDGHTAKFVRALGNGEKACQEFEGKEGFVIKGELWKVMAQMVMDSVEGHENEGARWVRGTGFDEAWKDIPGRARL